MNLDYLIQRLIGRATCRLRADAALGRYARIRNIRGDSDKIVVGRNVPFITGQFTSTGTGTNNPFQTIERKDVNGNYEPDNCCWIPKRDQPKNRECSIYLDSPWGRLSLQEAAAKIGISVPALFQRVKKGYDAYALYAPPAKKGAAVRPRNSPPIMVDTIWGELTLDEAAARIGVNRVTVQDRLRKGWSGDRLCAPSNQKEGLSGHGAD